MSSPGSVSRWIAALKVGDSTAAQPLWKRYYRQLAGLARRILRSARRVADEDDVVQDAFDSFFRAVCQGRFAQLDDRDGLKRLLVAITANKALKQLKHEQRLKRGGAALAKSQLLGPHNETALVQLVDAAPTPDFTAQVSDECRWLLELLGDKTLRQVAVWKMEGYGNHEIADKLCCSLRTVARKLDTIRILWSKEPAA